MNTNCHQFYDCDLVFRHHIIHKTEINKKTKGKADLYQFYISNTINKSASTVAIIH